MASSYVKFTGGLFCVKAEGPFKAPFNPKLRATFKYLIASTTIPALLGLSMTLN